MSGSHFFQGSIGSDLENPRRVVKQLVARRLIAVVLLLFIIHAPRPRSPLGMERDAQ